MMTDDSFWVGDDSLWVIGLDVSNVDLGFRRTTVVDDESTVVLF